MSTNIARARQPRSAREAPLRTLSSRAPGPRQSLPRERESFQPADFDESAETSRENDPETERRSVESVVKLASLGFLGQARTSNDADDGNL